MTNLATLLRHEQQIGAVLRSFQRGADDKTFSGGEFNEIVVTAIQNVLHSWHVGVVVVVTCGDGGKFSEIVAEDGSTPTTRAVRRVFPAEVASGRVMTHVNKSWGGNPGSGTALNDGLEIVAGLGLPFFMPFSSGLRITSLHIHRALEFLRENELTVCGVAREFWWRLPQWASFQNTFALWRTRALLGLRVKGFDPRCNGGDGRTVPTEHGSAPLAGMEDVDAFLRIMAESGGQLPRWGIISRANPVQWERSHIKPGTERFTEFMVKVARQYEVMKAWAKDIFPDDDPEEVISLFFSLGCDDGSKEMQKKF